MIPPKSNQQWEVLVTGQQTFEFDFLATKIFMNRVIRKTKTDPSKANISQCIDDAYNFFVKNEKSTQTDLNKIFG